MTVLVTGATGTVGSNVVRELSDRGEHVRVLVRDRHWAAALLGPEVQLAQGDFADSVRAALDGADRMFLACANVPNQFELETNAIDAPTAAGVRRVVKLSAASAEVGSPVDFWDWHARLEQHLQSSGTPYVLLKPMWYMSNLFAAADTIRQLGGSSCRSGTPRWR